MLAQGVAELSGFGRPFIANPDLISWLGRVASFAEVPKRYRDGDGSVGYSG